MTIKKRTISNIHPTNTIIMYCPNFTSIYTAYPSDISVEYMDKLAKKHNGNCGKNGAYFFENKIDMDTVCKHLKKKGAFPGLCDVKDLKIKKSTKKGIHKTSTIIMHCYCFSSTYTFFKNEISAEEMDELAKKYNGIYDESTGEYFFESSINMDMVCKLLQEKGAIMKA